MFLPRPSRFRRLFLPFLLFLPVLSGLAWYSGYLERTAYRLMIRSADNSGKSLGLEAYQVSIDALPIAGITRNASGLTWHPGRNSLFAVINQPAQVVELSPDGVLKRTVPVSGVADLEGITHVRGNEFFLADERTQQLIHVEIADDQARVETNGRPRVGLVLDQANNLGFEGVSWDHVHDRLYVVKEKRPLRLIELEGLLKQIDHQQLDLQIREWFPRGSMSLLLRDLSSLTYHEASGNMLLLSDESRLVVELDAERRPAGLLVLQQGWHGLKKDVPQAEGVAVDTQGTVFVLSEPNLFYRFERKKDPP